MTRLSPPKKTACEQIIRQVEKNFPELQVVQSKISQALCNPESGELSGMVSKWFDEGCHKIDLDRVRHELDMSGIRTVDIAKELNVSATTVWRRLERGTGTASQWDSMLAIFREELTSFTPATPDEKFVGGYCFAISTLRKKIAKALGLRAPRPIESREFCFLWHAIQNDAWVKTIDSGNDTLLDHVSRQIHQAVLTSFPSDKSAKLLSVAEIKQVHFDWYSSYMIIICCKIPRSNRGTFFN
ncbi:AsnC family protein [Gimesia algae]|uniref:Uncharacterized protein n=1 Tax=Gimesia algae TaxID=2527971 RepID=A0A517V6H6_9PLAN|nr:AsnC family protein [Gimesia algae]QDT88598.1 hypothetical protein Pan161_02160 [Gimesia algae]